MEKNKNILSLDDKKIFEYSHEEFCDFVLKGKNVSGKVFSDCCFRKVDFQNLEWEDSIFINCRFIEVKFTKNFFNNTKFENIEILKSEFDGLITVEFSMKDIKIENSIFNKCYLFEFSTNNLKIENSKIIKCRLENSKLKKSFFKNIIFTGNQTSHMLLDALTVHSSSILQSLFKNMNFIALNFSDNNIEKLKFAYTKGLDVSLQNEIVKRKGRVESIFEKKPIRSLLLSSKILFVLFIIYILLIYNLQSLSDHRSIINESLNSIKLGEFAQAKNIIQETIFSKENRTYYCKLIRTNKFTDQDIAEAINFLNKKDFKKPEDSWVYNNIFNMILKNSDNIITKKYGYDFLINKLQTHINLIENQEIALNLLIKFTQAINLDNNQLRRKLSMLSLDYRDIQNENTYRYLFLQGANASVIFGHNKSWELGKVLYLIKQDLKQFPEKKVFLYTLIMDIYDITGYEEELFLWLKLIFSSGYDNYWYKNSAGRKKAIRNAEHLIEKYNFDIEI